MESITRSTILGLALAVMNPHSGAMAGAFPGANGRIAFTSEFGSSNIMNPDGTDRELLFDGEYATWSPDGASLAMQSVIRVFVFDVATRRHRNVTPIDVRGPMSFSPDGRQLAFADQVDGVNQIFIVGVDGRGRRQLTANPEHSQAPAWSPDGDKIVFQRQFGAGWDLMVLNVVGERDVRWLAHGQNASWSPDGTRIAFESDRRGDSKLYIMDANGTNLRRATISPWTESDPSWSPDGTSIAYVCRLPASAGLDICRVTGLVVEVLTDTRIVATSPDWQRLPPRADDYLYSKAVDHALPGPPVDLSLNGPFGPNAARVQVRQVGGLATPNAARPNVLDPETHLLLRDLELQPAILPPKLASRPDSGVTPRALVMDRFGVRQLAIEHLAELALPAAVDPVNAPPPPDPAASGFERYGCHEIKELRAPLAPLFPNSANSRVVAIGGATLALSRPDRLCVPYAVAASPANHPERNLLCYRARAKDPGPPPSPVLATYELGLADLSQEEVVRYCVPAAMTILPSP